MSEKMKTIPVVLLLSFTCFLTQCQGCLKTDRVTHKLIPDQVMFTVSCGFPVPYFDVEILNSSVESYYYRAINSEMVNTAAAVNVLFSIGLYATLLFLNSRKRFSLKRFRIVSVVLILLFSTSLLAPYFPEFLQQVVLYIYLYPVGLISSMLGFVKLEAFETNMSPRIYLVLLISVVYFSIPLVLSIKKKVMSKF